jgi:hypothetical protein
MFFDLVPYDEQGEELFDLKAKVRELQKKAIKDIEDDKLWTLDYQIKQIQHQYNLMLKV